MSHKKRGADKKGADPRLVRQRHEEAIADLVRHRDALKAEIAALEARRHDTGDDLVRRTIDLLDLLDILEGIEGDAEWVRRKATIRELLRDRLVRRKAPSAQRLGTTGLPPALDKQLHDLVDAIQRENTYAHVSGDFSEKTVLQNRLLERYSEHLTVRWDQDSLILIEYRDRSAGHLPVQFLSAEARKIVGPKLGLVISPNS